MQKKNKEGTKIIGDSRRRDLKTFEKIQQHTVERTVIAKRASKGSSIRR